MTCHDERRRMVVGSVLLGSPPLLGIQKNEYRLFGETSFSPAGAASAKMLGKQKRRQ